MTSVAPSPLIGAMQYKCKSMIEDMTRLILVLILGAQVQYISVRCSLMGLTYDASYWVKGGR